MPDIIALANASEGIKSYAEAKERGDKLEMDRQRLQVESTLGAMQVQTQKEELFQRTQQSQQEFGLQEERFAFEKERMQPIIESNKVALKTLQDTQKALINQMNMTSKFETLYDELRAKFLSGEGEEGKLGEKQMRTGMEAEIEKGETEITIAKEERGEDATKLRRVKRETEAALGPLEVTEAEMKLDLLREEIKIIAPEHRARMLQIDANIVRLELAGQLDEAQTERVKAITEFERYLQPLKINQIKQDIGLDKSREKLIDAQASVIWKTLALQRDRLEFEKKKLEAQGKMSPLADDHYRNGYKEYNASFKYASENQVQEAQTAAVNAEGFFKQAGLDVTIEFEPVETRWYWWDADIGMPQIKFGGTTTAPPPPTTPTTTGAPQPEVTSEIIGRAKTYVDAMIQTGVSKNEIMDAVNADTNITQEYRDEVQRLLQ